MQARKTGKEPKSPPQQNSKTKLNIHHFNPTKQSNLHMTAKLEEKQK